MIYPLASLPLAVRNRVSQVTFHPTQPYLAVQSHDRSVEIFRIRTEEEALKKQARRKKREKEKAKNKKSKHKQMEEDAKDDNDEKPVSLEDLFTPYLVVRGSGRIRSFSFADEEPGPRGDTQVGMCVEDLRWVS